MGSNSFLIWWLLGAPLVLAIVDGMSIGKRGTSSGGEGYIARQGGGPGPVASGTSRTPA